MKKPKIIFTVINDLTYDQRMIRICKSLVTNGYEVLLVGRKLKKSIPLQEQPFQQKRLNCFFKKGKFFYLEYNLRLLFFLWKKKFDAVCAIDLDTILPAYYISNWKKKILIYDAHEYFTEVPEVVNRKRVKSIWEWVAKKTIPSTQYCYTVCESLSEIFKEEYGTDFEVIRNCPIRFNQESKKGHNPNSKKIILYQGALNEGRGLESMITAMQWVEDAEFWLAGEGDLSDGLRQLSTELELNKKIKFLGFQIPEELRRITPQAYLGINLLENKGKSYFYSLANKAFDYVQAGVPALHMDFPEYQKLNAEFEVSILMKTLDPKKLSKTINGILENEEHYKKMQEQCYKAKEIWTWENEERKLLKFYNEVTFSKKNSDHFS